MMILAVHTCAVLLFAGYLVVLQPVGPLMRAIQRLQDGNLGGRIERMLPATGNRPTGGAVFATMRIQRNVTALRRHVASFADEATIEYVDVDAFEHPCDNG